MTVPNTATSALTPSDLAGVLRYDEKLGRLVWKARPHGRGYQPHLIGKPACRRERGGYWRIRVFGQDIAEHRAIWAVCRGAWPAGDIDHIDGDRKNNALANLRDVSRLENARNSARQRNCRTGCSGVIWMPGRRKWVARIGGGPTRRYLGIFDDIGSAISARKAAEREMGYHPNHGREGLAA